MRAPPSNACRLPSMCSTRKPAMTSPVTAIITFFPIVDRYSVTHHMAWCVPLELDRGHRLPDGVRALREVRALGRRELDLVDFLQATPSELAWDAEEEIPHPILPFEPGGARQHTLLVPDDRFDHLDRGRGRCVVRRPGLEMLDDLGAAIARAHDHRVELRLVEQLRDR